MVQTIFYFGSFVFGVIIGSFLNVFLLRGGTGKWREGRSVCFSCGKNLRFLDMIPILSYFFLSGRCHFCRSKISFQYPLVELLTGCLFLFFFYFIFDNTFFSFVELFFMWVIGSMLVLITFYDIKHKIIPDGPESILFFVTLLRIFTNFYFFRDLKDLFFSLTAGLISSLPFFLLWFFSKGRWIGFGDVRLAIPLGWLVGLKLVLPSIIFSYWIGGIFVIFSFLLIKVLTKFYSFKCLKRCLLNRKTELPFAPFLIAGFLTAFLFDGLVYYLFPFLL
jgi:prepilin signal peptidase PulO-like enzyme (type II secretory pathway)